MSDLKTQIGELVTADLEECTLTFEVGKEIIAQAGKYAIVPIAEYEKMQANEPIETNSSLSIDDISDLLLDFQEYAWKEKGTTIPDEDVQGYCNNR